MVSTCLAQFLDKYKYFVRHIGTMEALFDASFAPGNYNSGNGNRSGFAPPKSFTTCGKTGLVMKLHTFPKPARLVICILVAMVQLFVSLQYLAAVQQQD